MVDVVVWLTGAGAPPDEAFANCIAHLGDRVRSVPQPLQLFAGSAPPDHYSLDVEIDAIDATLDGIGVPAAHIVGYSGGGGVGLAYALRRPDRVRSLALDEHVIGHRFGVDDEAALWDDIDEALQLDPVDSTLRIVRVLNGPDAPPLDLPSPLPAWVPSRLWGTPMLVRAVRAVAVGVDELTDAPWPVYASYGSATRAAMAAWCRTVAATVPNGTSEEYDGADHTRPAHHGDPGRFSTALTRLWAEAAR